MVEDCTEHCTVLLVQARNNNGRGQYCTLYSIICTRQEYQWKRAVLYTVQYYLVWAGTTMAVILRDSCMENSLFIPVRCNTNN